MRTHHRSVRCAPPFKVVRRLRRRVSCHRSCFRGSRGREPEGTSSSESPHFHSSSPIATTISRPRNCAIDAGELACESGPLTRCSRSCAFVTSWYCRRLTGISRAQRVIARRACGCLQSAHDSPARGARLRRRMMCGAQMARPERSEVPPTASPRTVWAISSALRRRKRDGRTRFLDITPCHKTDKGLNSVLRGARWRTCDIRGKSGR